MKRWQVTIHYAQPPSYTCEVNANTKDGALIIAWARAEADGFPKRAKSFRVIELNEREDE